MATSTRGGTAAPEAAETVTDRPTETETDTRLSLFDSLAEALRQAVEARPLHTPTRRATPTRHWVVDDVTLTQSTWVRRSTTRPTERVQIRTDGFRKGWEVVCQFHDGTSETLTGELPRDEAVRYAENVMAFCAGTVPRRDDDLQGTPGLAESA